MLGTIDEHDLPATEDVIRPFSSTPTTPNSVASRHSTWIAATVISAPDSMWSSTN